MFAASKEILTSQRRAMLVESLGVVVLDTTRFSRRNAGGCTGSGQVPAEGLSNRIRGRNDPTASEGSDQSCDGTEAMAVSGNESALAEVPRGERHRVRTDHQPHLNASGEGPLRLDPRSSGHKPEAWRPATVGTSDPSPRKQTRVFRRRPQ